MKKAIISLGNPLKSDDNVGNLVLDELKKIMKKNNTHFIKGSTNPENFIQPLRKINPGIIFFIDVALFEGKVGDVKLFQLKEILNVSVSTHNFPITVFKNFFPNSKIFLIGIKPKDLGVSEELSPELKSKLNDIVEKVKTIIEKTT
jgi:hydrogenase maturation protease HycI